jgi:cytochrome c
MARALRGPSGWRVGLLPAVGALTIALALAASDGAPHAAAQGDGDDLLLFSRTTGYRHTEAIDAGRRAIAEMGAADGFNVTPTEDPRRFTDAGLRSYAVIVLLHTDGEGILGRARRAAFERWVRRGGGVVSIHAAANGDRDWRWKTEMQGGARFLDHPTGDRQFQPADVQVEDGDHPATESLPPVWTRADEWYSFTANPRGQVHVLMTLEEGSYDLGGATPMGEDHPIAWCSNYDGGRHLYTALGHESPDSPAWSQPLYRSHIRGAIRWAAGEAPGDCGPDRGAGVQTEGEGGELPHSARAPLIATLIKVAAGALARVLE